MNKKSNAVIITLGRWEIIKDENLLVCGDESIILLPKVMKALEYFIEHPQQTITFDQLNNAIWPNEIVGDNSIYNIIGQLRKALGDVTAKPIYIETISKKGYRLIANVQVSDIEHDIESTLEKPKRTVRYLLSRHQVKMVLAVVMLLLFSLPVYHFFHDVDLQTQTSTTSDSEEFPNLTKQFLSMAKYHQFKGNKDKKSNKLMAINYYQKLLALVPNRFQAYQEIAFLNIEMMSLIPEEKALFYRKAKLAAETAKSLDNKPGNTTILLSYLKYIENQTEGSKTFELNFKSVEQQSFNISISARLAYANFLFKKGKVNDAIIQQKRVIEECSTCAETYRKLATSYMVIFELELAASYFNQYHELATYDNSNPIKIESQGSLSIKTLGDIYQWLAINSNKLSSKSELNYQTLLYLNLGFFEKANELTAQRNITEAVDFFTLYTLSAVAGANKKFENSFIYLKKRHELFPKNKLFSLSLSIAHWMQGDSKSALSLLQNKVIGKDEASSEQVDLKEPYYALLYAALLKSNGQRLKAKQLLLKTQNNLLKQATLNANNHMNLAIVYALLDENDSALASMKTSLDSGWVSDFNLSWWRIEDNPFLATLKDEKEFKVLISHYYQQLDRVTSQEAKFKQ